MYVNLMVNIILHLAFIYKSIPKLAESAINLIPKLAIIILKLGLISHSNIFIYLRFSNLQKSAKNLLRH